MGVVPPWQAGPGNSAPTVPGPAATVFPVHGCIVPGMPDHTIYLDTSLSERVRASNINVSRVCQQALRVALMAVGSVDKHDCPMCGQPRPGLADLDHAHRQEA